jgi:hypothetical protein
MARLDGRQQEADREAGDDWTAINHVCSTLIQMN